MNNQLKLLMVILTFINFLSCSHNSKSINNNKSERKYNFNSTSIANDTIKHQVDNQQIANLIKPHIESALNFYESGDFKNAYDEFQNAFTFLELISISDDSAKIDFINKHIDIPAKFKSINIASVYQEIFCVIIGASEIEEETESDQIEPASEEISQPDTVEIPLPSEEYQKFIADEIQKLASKFGEDYNIQLPQDFIEEVELHIGRFQTSKRDFFKRAIRRSRKYIPLIKPIFKEKEIPEELIYMLVVESGFSPISRSRASAVGLWQFIKSTARLYGLKVNRHIDERYDPIKSTYAAREYLLDLLSIFGSRSFMLAIAAYNTGEGNVQKALRKLDNYKNRSFLALRSSGFLYRETNNYVPQILAAIIIGTNLSKFGFENIEFIDEQKYTLVKIPYSTSLSIICNETGITREELYQLNPDLPTGATKTPTRVINYPLFVPKEKKDVVNKRLAEFIKIKVKPKLSKISDKSKSVVKTVKTEKNYKYIAYKVKRGNSLNQISKWFNKPISDIKNWNKYLYKRSLKIGDTVYIYELDPSWKKYTHRVKGGDNLFGLSRFYGVSINDIKGWNGLRGSRIYKGQRLLIYTNKNVSPKKIKQITKYGIIETQRIPKGRRFRYRVVRGNTVTDLAKFFKISANKIKKWNRLSGNRLNVNKMLTLYASREMRFYRYVVKKGDTLSSISKKFGISISNLKELNGIVSSRLYVGDELRIFSF